MYKAFKSLTWRQKQAIRNIKDNPDAIDIHKHTVNSLVKKGFIEHDSGQDYLLTPAGEWAYKTIMASGDGPEALKEMLTFGKR